MTVLVLAGKIASGQFESTIIPYSNQVLLNPAFAGFQKRQNFWVNSGFTSISKTETYKRYSFIYDNYFHSIKSGISGYYNKGLAGGINLSSIETGFSFSTSVKIGRYSNLITSFNTSYAVLYKNLYAGFIDYLLDNKLVPYSLPGEETLRFSGFNPKIGVIVDLKDYYFGISFHKPIYKPVAGNLTPEELKIGENYSNFIVHFSGKEKKLENGLVSKIYLIVPEVVIIYSNRNIAYRVGFKKEYTKYTAGVFAYQNIRERQIRAGTVIGYKSDLLKVNLATGAGIPFVSKTISFSGELSLGIIIPYSEFSKNLPWSPAVKKIQ